MGIEIEVNSLEEMCDLMCYNKLPRRRSRMTRDETKAYLQKELDSAYERKEKIGHKEKTRYIIALETALSVLEDRPTGHWIEHEKVYECSECHIVRAKGMTGRYNYCPSCGAEMENSNADGDLYTRICN